MARSDRRGLGNDADGRRSPRAAQGARRSPRQTGTTRLWWWLAVPLLGIAAWAAFSATSALLGDDGRHAPPVP
ncbi:hypothetical protein K2Z84_29585, partial [Candidatus Binatia bacterium]|nr:hypothetical protein [Candidatus Binatia bacterium]